MDLTALRLDCDGQKKNVITFIDASTPDSTELAAYKARTQTGDYTVNSSTNQYTFLSDLSHLVVRLTNDAYSQYVFESEEFCINDPTETAIHTITLDGTGRDANAIYDLQGRKVANPTPGIYIIGGRKVLIK